MYNLQEALRIKGLNKLLAYVEDDPDRNIPKAMDWIAKFDTEGVVNKELVVLRESLKDQNSHWFQFVRSIYQDIDASVRKTLMQNLIIEATILGGNQRKKLMDIHDCQIPWAILLDPTSACNLKCVGCWADNYGRELALSFSELDDIISQGKALGTYMYIFSGGEPLLRWPDIKRLCEKHTECAFLAFTNGTLIDEAMADGFLQVKNFIPAISLEGFAQETDARRGTGTYQAVKKALALLQRKRLPYGISCCYTAQNAEVVGSEAYFDEMVAAGAKFAWFFTYMPVGQGAGTELMATAAQRKMLYHNIRAFRQTKPLFTIDFWNDGEYVKGCIAGGRCYLHINANGDIEPCAFIHYADCNIHEHTLLQAYQAPLFKQYRANQPFNENHLRPCPLLDNPQYLKAMVEASGAHSTERLQPEAVAELCNKCKPASEKWAEVADQLWSAKARAD
jgi:MoaA/NifB/PqqE/SkfB family radical SAM enzyme